MQKQNKQISLYVCTCFEKGGLPIDSTAVLNHSCHYMIPFATEQHCDLTIQVSQVSGNLNRLNIKGANQKGALP